MGEKTFIKHTSHDSMVLGENLKAENTRIGKYVDITRVWGQPSPANYAAACSTFNCRRWKESDGEIGALCQVS